MSFAVSPHGFASSPHGPGQFPGPVNPATLPQPTAPTSILPPYLGNIGMRAPGNFAMNGGQALPGVPGARTVSPQLLAALLSQYRAGMR
jgi:hypothetical protein